MLQIRELEELMADTARWDALPPQERKEKQQHFNTTSECLFCLPARPCHLLRCSLVRYHVCTSYK
jgi:hypothetical protein